MTTPDPLDNGWDDWRRPTSLREVWPLVIFVLTPVFALLLAAFFIARELGLVP